MKKKRVRKPRALRALHVLYPHVGRNVQGKSYAWMGGHGHTPAECRALAEWLIQASEYLEAKEKK